MAEDLPGGPQHLVAGRKVVFALGIADEKRRFVATVRWRHALLRSCSGGIARDRRRTAQRKLSGIGKRPTAASAVHAPSLTARTPYYGEETGKLPDPHSCSFVLASGQRAALLSLCVSSEMKRFASIAAAPTQLSTISVDIPVHQCRICVTEHASPWPASELHSVDAHRQGATSANLVCADTPQAKHAIDGCDRAPYGCADVAEPTITRAEQNAVHGVRAATSARDCGADDAAYRRLVQRKKCAAHRTTHRMVQGAITSTPAGANDCSCSIMPDSTNTHG